MTDSYLPFVLLYLDPGSGSFLLQALLAGCAGVAVFLKARGRSLMSLFRGRSSRPVADKVEDSKASRGPTADGSGPR